MDEQARSFGSFALFPTQRLLLQDGKPLKLGSRALDILLVLTERAGEIIAKEALLARVWPDTFVEDTSLRVHIGNLRKALGDTQSDSRFITNVPGRGYCFVAPVKLAGAEAPARPAPASLRNFPVAVGRTIGRDTVVANLATELTRQRLLTIAGPGGIGKTTVALAVARAAAEGFTDGSLFVDFSPVTDPAMVPAAVAAGLGHALRSMAPIDELIAVLAERKLLIVLDSCEHVIEAAAAFVEALLRRTAGVTILTSSREPLRAEGEWVHRLAPLDVPPEAAAADAESAIGFSAVRLFAERSSACLGGYTLTDADAPVVIEICRRLDGIALAIELAAGRVDTIGLRGLANSLDDCFRVLTRGRRTALPRHQTLRATLDWSYGLLPPQEQIVFQHLSVFNGSFTLDAAVSIEGGGIEVEDALSNLAAKSLVTASFGPDGPRYRLLDTTRTYARMKLAESGDENGCADAMPNITGISSCEPRRSGSGARRPTGLPPMAVTSTICGRHSTGPSPKTATPRSRWR